MGQSLTRISEFIILRFTSICDGTNDLFEQIILLSNYISVHFLKVFDLDVYQCLKAIETNGGNVYGLYLYENLLFCAVSENVIHVNCCKHHLMHHYQ